MHPVHVFTSITANYIPKARVLASSVKRCHPEINFHLVLSDNIPKNFSIENELFDSVITIEELPIPNIKSWIFKHSIVEMCTGVKGVAFKEIFRRYNCEKVIFFDPDIVILDRLDTIINKLDTHSILLTPHQTKPEEYTEAVIDNEICSLKHGVFNLGFLAVSNSEEGKNFLNWWSSRCLEFCYDDIPGGLFTDQRWVDLAPAFFSNIGVLHDPIYNVATWNLTHRTATGSLEQGILVNGEPLCFYHFSGFDSGAQAVMLQKYGESSPVLFSLREWYIKECAENGQDEFGKIPCVYSFFDNGELITREQRLLYRHRLDLQQAYPNPFSTTASNSYLNWYLYQLPIELSNQPKSYQAIAQELMDIKAELEQANALIRGMESSKFWKMRKAWFGVKQASKVGIKIIKKSTTLSAKLINKIAKPKAKELPAKVEVFQPKQKVAEVEVIVETPPVDLDIEKSSSLGAPILKINAPDSEATLSGLTLISGQVIYLDPNFPVGRLELSVDGNVWVSISTNQCNQTASINADKQKVIDFESVINTHLLENGVNILQIRLVNTEGEEVTASKIKFNVNNTGELAMAISHYLRKQPETKLVLQGMIDSSDFPYSGCPIGAWFDKPDAIEQIPDIIEKYSLPEEFSQHLTNFVTQGYISLDSFLDLELVAQVNAEVEQLITDGSVSYVPESGDRIEHLFQKSKSIYKIWRHPVIIQLLSALFDDIAVPCQTLNFIHGSQQAVHQDVIHLTPFPEGYMCGVWVALEDISPDAGPLFVYPKSHRLPCLYAKTVGIDKLNKYWDQHLIDEYTQKYLPTLKSHLSDFKVEEVSYTPKAGSVFIWHANLSHGGSARKVKNATRKSMVSHYFAKGAIAFYDSTGTIGYKHESVD